MKTDVILYGVIVIQVALIIFTLSIIYELSQSQHEFNTLGLKDPILPTMWGDHDYISNAEQLKNEKNNYMDGGFRVLYQFETNEMYFSDILHTTFKEEYSVIDAPCRASMYPNIACGDKLVLFSEVYDKDRIGYINNGNLIMFDSPEGKIVHRVVDKYKNPSGDWQFRTKGDNNKIRDDWIIDEKNNIQKVVAVVMNGY